MKRLCIAAIVAAFAVAAFAPAAYAGKGNPSPTGTGPPGQSCQAFLPGGVTPGHTASSPGSPFDEPGFGSAPNGGTGGLNYSEKSQYDVACYHLNT
jgi:hypothetical protein